MNDLVPNESEFLLYSTPEGDVRLEVLLQGETVWLTQKAMQDLFGRAKSTISEHISNVFEEGELAEDQVVRKYRTTADDGKDYFLEILERVSFIRANERRIYQQITDIFQECCIDYDRNSNITKTFFATVQNKFRNRFGSTLYHNKS